ncbi:MULTISPECIES: antirestriction protein [Providencia]|uniref:KlcA family antirestriction protein n=1 Tax=Providencia heimbachae ATCC 35613 TaxID=1354272 RepID=A0A1B7JVT0_9GAMM|nr:MULTISPECIES: antirestriction protein [Providencia]MTC56793.1 antirestriction protein [Providencia rustigianii]OAT51972.1 KlcA family antirestriction protein [Providencia heimbachae ATCC 35613]SQH15237.1 Antirestriction protein [Providencia heimbachae]
MNNSTECTITMTLVPDEQRLDFWLNHFGRVKGWTTFEVVIFTTMGQFCDDYHGGYWEYGTLSNGGTFIYPDISDETLTLFNPHNGNEAVMSQQAAGIAVCLILYSIWSFKTESEVMCDRFYQLREYALQHAESAAIFHFID